MSYKVREKATYEAGKLLVDPSLGSQDYGSCLIIGRSGTGKSTLLKKLLENYPKKVCVYLVNVKSGEAFEYTKGRSSEKIFHCKIGGLEKINRGSVVIVEDLITMGTKDGDSLRHLLNYTAHHRFCKIFCVTHTIHKTGIYSMLPLFNYVIFTSSPSNVPIVRLTLMAFKIEKPQLENWVGEIKGKEHEAEGNYFFLTAPRWCLEWARIFWKKIRT